MNRNKTRIITDLFPMIGLRGPSAKGVSEASDQPAPAGEKKKRAPRQRDR